MNLSTIKNMYEATADKELYRSQERCCCIDTRLAVSLVGRVRVNSFMI